MVVFRGCLTLLGVVSLVACAAPPADETRWRSAHPARTTTQPQPVDGSHLAPQVITLAHQLNDYWSDKDSVAGEPMLFTAVPLSRISVGEDGVLCHGKQTTLQDLEHNALAATCPEGNMVAFDQPYALMDPVRLEATLSHEWAHLLQFENGHLVEHFTTANALPVHKELQADCLSGVWTKHNSPHNLVDHLHDLASVGDHPDDDHTTPDAHGTAEHRQQAFLTGYDNTIDACFEGFTEQFRF